jgi:hypothetical protein
VYCCDSLKDQAITAPIDFYIASHLATSMSAELALSKSDLDQKQEHYVVQPCLKPMQEIQDLIYARNTGFDAIRDGLDDNDNQFNVDAFDKVSDFFLGMGVDADSVIIGQENGHLQVNLIDSNGVPLGSIGMIDEKWKYSIDGKLMRPADSMKQAGFGIINQHIDKGGLIS